MSVGAIIRGKGGQVVTARDSDSVLDVVKLLREKRIGAVVVEDAAGSMAGIFSERDVVRNLADHGPAILDKPARTIMTENVVTCSPNDSVQDAMALMTTRRIRHLPVLSEGVMIGVVSIGDLVKARIEEAEREAEALKSYISAG